MLPHLYLTCPAVCLFRFLSSVSLLSHYLTFAASLLSCDHLSCPVLFLFFHFHSTQYPFVLFVFPFRFLFLPSHPIPSYSIPTRPNSLHYILSFSFPPPAMSLHPFPFNSFSLLPSFLSYPFSTISPHPVPARPIPSSVALLCHDPPPIPHPPPLSSKFGNLMANVCHGQVWFGP